MGKRGCEPNGCVWVIGSAKSTSASVSSSALNPGTLTNACGKPAAWCLVIGGREGTDGCTTGCIGCNPASPSGVDTTFSGGSSMWALFKCRTVSVGGAVALPDDGGVVSTTA